MCYNIIIIYNSISIHFSIQFSRQEAFLVNDYYKNSGYEMSMP